MLLEIQDISKSYSKKGTVLDHISFQMREGIYGLLGPNGAGKTTLMNIMTANLQPDGGCTMERILKSRESSIEQALVTLHSSNGCMMIFV